MGDLNIYNLSFKDITLEKLDVNSPVHISVMESMRDYTATEMCYDVLRDVEAEKENRSSRNCFLAKNSNGYFGYINISDDREGDRILCYIIQEKLRGMGLGKVLLSYVSDYLLDSNIASSVKMYISRKNVASINVASFCGFEPKGSAGGDMIQYHKTRL